MKATFRKLCYLIIIIGTIASVAINNCYAQTGRGSVWVHGLNGSGSDWSKWESLFTNERRMTDIAQNGSIPISYSTDNGVPFMASQVRSRYGGDSQNIFFGHSMGGVAGREIDVNNNGSFGGIVTFGSPLDGARVANSLSNGQANTFISEGVDKVTRGPIRQLGQLGQFFSIAGRIGRDVLTNYIQGQVTQFFPVNQGTRDLEENSAYMNSGIRGRTTNTPKIHIYGNEEGPVLWRFASSANEKVNGRPSFNDTEFVNVASTARDIYNAAMWANIGLGIYYGFTFQFGKAAGAAWTANGWAEGRDWWQYDSENGWNSLIGASTLATKTLTYKAYDNDKLAQCMKSVPYNSGYYDYYLNCSRNSFSWVTTTYYSPVNGQSDAFIKAPSQTGYNSDWSNNATKIEALGVNHIEMLDNDKIKDILNRIFDGLEGDRSFFPTARR